MRRSERIERIWASGLYMGINQADTRVTVDRDWLLRTGRAPGTSMYDWRQPARYFQRRNPDQIEVDIPRQIIRSVSIDRQISSDTAQLTITCWNADPTTGPNPVNQGMFSQRRGFEGPTGLRLTESAAGRWADMVPSSWSTVHGDKAHSYGRIAQGNMLRTYQGYGSWLNVDGRIVPKPRLQAMAAGELVKTGIWIIDDVTVDHEGNIEISARDVGALLVDQIMYPPFMGRGCYPTQFYSATWNREANGNPNGFYPSSTNYRDLTDIVRLVLIWAGFWMYGGGTSRDGRWPAILGGLENTGIDSPSIIGADVFDKRPPIDAIKTIRDIVGYETWIDQEGGFRFQSANIWEAGNFDYAGVHHRFAFDIDEEVNLLSLTMTGTKKLDRSQVIVAMADPYRNAAGTVKLAAFNTNTASTKNQLHGMVSPAIIGLDKDIPQKEMTTLAELTGLRIWFMRRRGSIKAAANPLIDVDDQVRAWERTTAETYLQRVETIRTTHDFEDGGQYTMELGTHWLGADNADWGIRVGPEGHVNYNTSVTGDDIGRRRDGQDSSYPVPVS